MTETVHIVEVEIEPDGIGPAQIRAAQIDQDRKTRGGRFRREGVIRCQGCTDAGRKAGTIATIYVGPGAARFVHLPSRQSSAGAHSRGIRLSARAFLLPELATGVVVTQCRTCLTYVAVTAAGREDGRGLVLCVTGVLRSTFGSVKETGVPTVVHEVPSVGAMSAWHRHAVQATQ